MKNKMLSAVLMITACLLFPYIAALAVGTVPGKTPSEIFVNGRTVQINDNTYIPAEGYLIGILAAQADPACSEEMLKAQAVLARTGLYSLMTGTVVSAETLEERKISFMSLGQMKKKWGSNTQLWYMKLCSAVLDTMGECAFYGDDYILPLFHGVSAGSTRADITGKYPYLISVECGYDAEAPGYQQVKILNQKEFEDRLAYLSPGGTECFSGISADSIKTTVDDSGYVLNADINGFVCTGDQLAQALGFSSPWIRIEDYADGKRVLCKGTGHGMGMSQWGAEHYAACGKDYIWILKTYFNDISVKTV